MPKIEHNFKLNDHVIWQSDTPPREVCYLADFHTKGYVDQNGIIVTHDELNSARPATGKEIYNHYNGETNED